MSPADPSSLAVSPQALSDHQLPRAISTPDETSPRPHERVLDPARAATYGHHRQTSIVHGIQHSRNGSLASPTSSPLSPQMINAANNTGFDRHDMQSVSERLEADMPGSRPPTAMAGSIASNANNFPLDKSATAALEVTSPSMTPRRNDRMQSRSRAQNSSQSSHLHRDDQKTVGEYALHVLFTSVSARGYNRDSRLLIYACSSLRKPKKSSQHASPCHSNPSLASRGYVVLV